MALLKIFDRPLEEELRLFAIGFSEIAMCKMLISLLNDFRGLSKILRMAFLLLVLAVFSVNYGIWVYMCEVCIVA